VWDVAMAFGDVPDLIVDGIQLLLQHAGQGLGVGVARRGQNISEDALSVFPVLGVATLVASLAHVPGPVVLDDLRTRDDRCLDRLPGEGSSVELRPMRRQVPKMIGHSDQPFLTCLTCSNATSFNREK